MTVLTHVRRLLAPFAAAAILAAGPAHAGDRAGTRIVSVGGTITEIVHALGAGDRLVAVDTTSTHPPEAAARPSVGYMRALSAEGILSLRPSAVLAQEGSGPPAVLELIRGAGIPLHVLPDEPSPEGVVRRIRQVASLIGADETGAALASSVAAKFAALAAGPPTRPLRVLFLISLQGGRPMAAGSGTAAAAMIGLSGATNAAEGFEGYKPLTDEAVAASRPDVVLMMERAGASMTPEALFALPAFARTPAASRKALVVMDGLYLLGFGPRTPDAIRDLRAALSRAAGSGS